jgi:signal transduction histidine kinase
MLSLTFFQVSTLITAFASLFLGFFVYLNGEKTKLNRSWLFASAVIFLWSIGLFGVVFSTDTKNAWTWQYILDIGGICIPALYLNFLLHLTKKENKLIWLQIFSLIAVIFLILLNFTDFFKTGVSPKFGINYWIDPGQLYVLFPLYFCLLVVASMVVVIKEYKVAVDINYKQQLLYVLIAQTFGYGGGLTDFFPQVFNVYPFGNYLVVLYVIFISYAALKHRLFNIKVIATELLVFTIWVFLAARTLLSTGYNEFILNGCLFVVMVVAGILLIRSVLNEVRQREIIEKIEKEVERAYKVEKNANEELKQLDAVKNQFLMQTQHDLRSPLGVIRGYCDLLISGTLGKQSQKTIDVLQRIEIVAEEKIRDVNNFLDVAQFRLGKGVVNLKQGVGLVAMLNEIINAEKLKAKQNSIYLKFETAESEVLISADKEKLKAAIFNIVDNAIKYTKSGGVSVSLQPDIHEKKNILIIIKDTGIGISKDKIETIFEGQFMRTAQAQKTAEGKGIGLYLSGQIIKMHNGKVWVESDGEGKGCVFYVELPL